MPELELIDKHISKWILPREEMLSWIKWPDDYDFDTLEIRSEADINMHRILNVDESVLEQDILKNGMVVINKELLQIPGFVGFECFYELVPEQERELNFEIVFYKDDVILETVCLKTNLIRPILMVENMTNNGIVVTKDTTTLPKLNFKIKNISKARVLNFSPFIEVVNAKDMKITIENIKSENESNEPLFVYSNEIIVPKFIVRGKGYGMVSMGYEYSDAIGNKYQTKLVDIPIMIEQKESVEVPISSDLSGQSTLLLEPKIS